MPKGDRHILKADPEDGTTPVANLLLEALAMAKLSGVQKGAVAYLWRRTYGWLIDGTRLKEADIPLSEWMQVLNATKSSVSESLKGLCAKRVFNRKLLGGWKGYRYSLNTHISQWDSGCINHQLLATLLTVPLKRTVPQNRTVTEKPNRTVPQNRTEQFPKTEPPSNTNSASLKESQKERLNKDTTTIQNTPSLKLLKTLQGLPNWKPNDDDAQWLEEFLHEFSLTESHIKGCRDHHSGKKGKLDSGIWKNRLRNWMTQDGGYKGQRVSRPRPLKEHTTKELSESWQRRPDEEAGYGIGDPLD